MPLSAWRKWWRRSSPRSNKTSKKPHFRKCFLEILEDRNLLSNTYTVNLVSDNIINTGQQTGPASGDLRWCIEQADLNPGSTITFDPTVFPSSANTTIQLSQGELQIAASMNIQGPGANTVTVSGNDNKGGASRVFDVTNSSSIVTIAGLTIANGNANVTHTPVDGNQGGDIFNGGNLTLQNDIVTGGTSRGYIGGPNARGGAIFNAEGQGNTVLILDNTIVENNLAWGVVGGNGPNGYLFAGGGGNGGPGEGGGIYNDVKATLIVKNGSQIINNTALGGDGGDGGLGLTVSPPGAPGGIGGKGGNAGFAQGGGVFNAGYLQLNGNSVTSIILADNVAQGGKGGLGGNGGTGQNGPGGGQGGNSGSGGNGGFASGGAIYNTGSISFPSTVSLQYVSFLGDQSIGGAGNNGGLAGAGGNGTKGPGGTGGEAGFGGAGGNSQGGAIYTAWGALTVPNILFGLDSNGVGDQALGGAGGNGGDAGHGGDSGGGSTGSGNTGAPGGNGGVGGDAGFAKGGAVANLNPGGGNVAFTNTIVDSALAQGGVGGNGGNAGYAGAGAKGNEGTKASNYTVGIGGLGGRGGNSGAGGAAIGGGVFNAVGTLSILDSFFLSSRALGGAGGAAGNGGNGGIGGARTSKALTTFLPTTRVGGHGGSGGTGGVGGAAQGGGFYNLIGSVTVLDSTFQAKTVGGVGNEAISGNGGAGGAGGNGGQGGDNGATKGNVLAGDGGNGGVGGVAGVAGLAEGGAGGNEGGNTYLTGDVFTSNLVQTGIGGAGGGGGTGGDGGNASVGHGADGAGGAGGGGGNGATSGPGWGGAFEATASNVTVTNNTFGGVSASLGDRVVGGAGGAGGNAGGVGHWGHGAGKDYRWVVGYFTAGNGGRGGDGTSVYGGSLAVSANTQTVKITGTTFTNSAISSGAGGNGGQAGLHSFDGRNQGINGTGGNGGLAQGGAVSLSASAAQSATLSNVTVSSTTATAGAGGAGAINNRGSVTIFYRNHNGYGSPGGNGGSVHGVGLADVNYNLALSNSSFDHGTGQAGKAGAGGTSSATNAYSFQGGPGGNGGNALGGGVSFSNNTGNALSFTFNTGSASSNSLAAGAGGNGGFAGASSSRSIAGGSGGAGGTAQGGGIYILANGASVNTTALSNLVLDNNVLAGGTGGVGGAGSSNVWKGMIGAHGGNGGAADGGGVFNTSFNGAANSTLTVSASTLAGNQVTGGIGGDAGSGTTPNGGAGGAGGNGGNAEGAGLFDGNNTPLSVVNSTFGGQSTAANVLIGSRGGRGGDAGTPNGVPQNNGGNGGSGGTIAGANIYVASNNAVLPAPDHPQLVVGFRAGGTWTAQTAWVKITYVNTVGETTGSAFTTIGVPAGGTLTIVSPTPMGTGAGAATGWYAYVGVGATQPANTALYRQQLAGSPTAIGANLTLSAPPTTTGANPPTTNTALATTAAFINDTIVDGQAVSPGLGGAPGAGAGTGGLNGLAGVNGAGIAGGYYAAAGANLIGNTILDLNSDVYSVVKVPTSFAGIDYNNSNNGAPPNTQGAVGPNSYIETVNQSIAIYNKSDGTNLALDSLADFWVTQGNLPRASAASTFANPTVLWNAQIGRFIVAEQDVDTTNHISTVDIAISNSSNPGSLKSGDWTFYQVSTTENIGDGFKFNFDAANLGSLGWNNGALIFTLNMLNQSGTIDHVQVNAISMNALVTGTALTPGTNAFRTDFAGANLRPTVMHDSQSLKDPMWFIEEGGDDKSINVVEMTNVLSASPTFASTNLLVNHYSPAVATRQPSGVLASNVNSSIQNVAEQNGLLVTAQTVSNSTGSQDYIQWYVVDVTGNSPKLQQEGDVSGGGNVYDAFPSIDINSQNSIGLTYVQSSPGQFMSMYVTGRQAFNPAGLMATPVLVRAGTSNYSDFTGGSEGSLSSLSVDSDGSFWAANEFANNEAGANWGTQIANFNLAHTNDMVGPFNSLGYNIVGSIPGVSGGNTFSTKLNDQIGITAAQLRLGPLLNNGGATLTDALLPAVPAQSLPASVAIDAGGNTLVTNAANPWYNLYLNNLSAPAAPSLAVSNSGGTWSAQTAWVLITYVNANGETTGSVLNSIAVPVNGILTINSPAAEGTGAAAATGWYAYVGVGSNPPDNTALYRQQAAGSPTLLGTPLTLKANPTTTGANPPTNNTALIPTPTDQRGPGFPRLDLSGKIVDIGAYELNKPIIDSLNPPSQFEQSGTFTLTINGTGFVPGALVSFGSAVLTPTSITSTAITVTVPAALLPDEGAVNVTVSIPDGSGIAGETLVSNTVVFQITEGPTLTVNNPGNQFNNESDKLQTSKNTALQITSTDPDTTFNDLNANGQHTLPPGLFITAGGLIYGTIDKYAVTNGGSSQNFNVTINGIDDGVLRGSTTFVWNVADTTPPTITVPPKQNNNEGDVITSLPVSVVDADPGTITDVVGGKHTLPTGLSIDPNTGKISGTIDSRAAGTYTVTISASDNGVASTANFTWVVADTTPPTIANPGNQISNEGATINLSLNAVDADSFSATGLPPGLSIDPKTGAITGTIDPYAVTNPTGSTNGVDYQNFSVTITALDNGYQSAPISFTWTVNDTKAPTINSPGTLTNNESDNVKLQITDTDADAGTFTDVVNGVHTLPTGLSIDGNGLITGTIAPYAVTNGKPSQDFSVTISASDGSNVGSTTFTWTVNDTTAPTVTAPANQTNDEGTIVKGLAVTATDADSFAITGLPTGLTFDSTTGVISGTIGAYAAGTYNVSITATDNGNVSKAVGFTWTVNDTTLPTISSPGDQTNNEGDAVKGLTITATDAEKFSMSGQPLGLNINAITGVISGTIDSRAAGSYQVTVTAYDGNLQSSTTFNWTVKDTTPPLLNNPGPQNGDEGDKVSLQINSTDADQGSFTDVVNGQHTLPTGLTIDPQTGAISGTIDPRAVSNGQSSQVFNVTISATDGSSTNTGSTSFTWTVSDTSAPTLVNPGGQSNSEGDTLSLADKSALQIQATDADSFSATGLPTGLSIDPKTGIITGTIDPYAANSSPYSVTVYASDNGNSSSVTFNWLVTDSTPPSFTNPGDQVNNEGDAVTLATDPVDADPGTIMAIGLPPGLSIDANSGVISGTIDSHGAGAYAVSISGSDNGHSAGVAFVWRVNDSTPPVLTNPGGQSSSNGMAVSLTIHAIDADPGTFKASGLPAGLNIDPRTGVIFGTVSTAPGTYHVTVSGADSGVVSSVAFPWTVSSNSTSTVITNVHNTYVGFVQYETVTAEVTDPNGVVVNSGFVTFNVNGQSIVAPVVNGFASTTIVTNMFTLDLTILLNDLFTHSLDAVYSDPAGIFGNAGGSVSEPGMLLDYLLFLESVSFGSLAQQLTQLPSS